jgi:hypothetical protein
MEEKGRILSLRIAHYDRPLIAGSSRLLRRRQRQHPPSETIAIPSAADDLRPRAVTTQRRPAFDPTARCFWIEAGERQTATIICCRKSEIKLSFPHEQFCAAPWPRLRATVPLLSRTEEAPRKSFARRKNPHLWLLDYLGFPWILASESRLINVLPGPKQNPNGSMEPLARRSRAGSIRRQAAWRPARGGCNEPR